MLVDTVFHKWSIGGMEYLQEQDAALSQTQTRNTWDEQQLTDCHHKKIGQRTGS